MRIALAQINSSLAGFESNKDKILEYINRAKEKKAELVIFPEASLFGYHPFDLLERESLVDQQNSVLKQLLKKIPAEIYVLIGGFEKNKNKKGKPYFNAAFLCQKNKIVQVFHKELFAFYRKSIFFNAALFNKSRFVKNITCRQKLFIINSGLFAFFQNNG